MANYHFEVRILSRGKCRSIVRSASYITGKKLYDCHNEKTYYNRRMDVLYHEIFLPDRAPSKFRNLQNLCDEINKAERRYDARTAREFIGSLPNELPLHEQKRIVEEFINRNFITYDLCAIAAIHEGKNEIDPRRNNPHVHIIVSTRSIDEKGFSQKKNRELDKKKYVDIWREEWANGQNRAYERNGMDIRVSDKSLAVQGKDQEPTIHLSRIDWQKEKLGERTADGDKKRAIKLRNEERIRKKQLEQEHCIEMELSR